MKLILLFLIGLIFGTGISLSGMANPAKVLNFFDIAGTWDPSLAFVMGGALVVAAIGYRLVFRRDTPLMAPVFQIPAGMPIDAPLVGGSALFGVGWAIAGFCPGAALPVVGTGNTDVLLFVAATLVGMFIARRMQKRLA